MRRATTQVLAWFRDLRIGAQVASIAVTSAIVLSAVGAASSGSGNEVTAFAAEISAVTELPPTSTPVPTTVPPTPSTLPAPTTTLPPTTTTSPPATTKPTLPGPPPTNPPAPEPESECHRSYVGDCLPVNASDVDCGGGSGNGPVYASVKGFRVVGPDVYDLDRDGNGIACES